MRVRVCVCVRACACVRVCVCPCVCECPYVSVKKCLCLHDSLRLSPWRCSLFSLHSPHQADCPGSGGAHSIPPPMFLQENWIRLTPVPGFYLGLASGPPACTTSALLIPPAPFHFQVCLIRQTAYTGPQPWSPCRSFQILRE